MKCDQVKQSIYLYDELSASEKRACDAHISECKRCALLFMQFKQQQQLISKVAAWKEQPENAGKMTQNIMAAVINTSQKRISPVDVFINKFRLMQLRLSLSFISLFLIIFFVVEFNDPLNHVPNLRKSSLSKPVPKRASLLNAAQIFEHVKAKQKENERKKATEDCLKRIKFAGQLHTYNKCNTSIQNFIRNHESN